MRYQYKREPLTADEATRLANACNPHEEKLVVWTLSGHGTPGLRACQPQTRQARLANPPPDDLRQGRTLREQIQLGSPPTHSLCEALVGERYHHAADLLVDVQRLKLMFPVSECSSGMPLVLQGQCSSLVIVVGE